MTGDRFSVSLPESLRSFLERQQRGLGLESIDKYVERLILKARETSAARISLLVDNRRCAFRRLSDSQFANYARRSIALNDLSEITSYQIRTGKPDLAETYASCRLIFGERGRLFDDWKGAFSFPLAIEIEGVEQKPCYLLDLFNFRSSVDFRLRQMVNQDDPRLATSYLYEHDEAYLSTSLLTELIFQLIGYLEGFLIGYQETGGWSEPFLFAVQSNLILFGFSPDDKFFNRQFATPEEYEATYKQLRDKLPTPGFWMEAIE